MQGDYGQWEEERRNAQQAFFRLYEKLRKPYHLRMHLKTSLFEEGLIKIWRCEGEEAEALIAKVEEEDDVELYKRATSDLISFKKIMEESQNG